MAKFNLCGGLFLAFLVIIMLKELPFWKVFIVFIKLILMTLRNFMKIIFIFFPIVSF